MDTSYIGQLVSGAFYLIVGIALLGLAHRTAETPERLLGIYFLFTGLDYTLYTVAVAFEFDSIFDPAAALARVAYAIAVLALWRSPPDPPIGHGTDGKSTAEDSGDKEK